MSLSAYYAVHVSFVLCSVPRPIVSSGLGLAEAWVEGAECYAPTIAFISRVSKIHPIPVINISISSRGFDDLACARLKSRGEPK
jgi:hypothetical protein